MNHRNISFAGSVCGLFSDLIAAVAKYRVRSGSSLNLNQQPSQAARNRTRLRRQIVRVVKLASCEVLAWFIGHTSEASKSSILQFLQTCSDPEMSSRPLLLFCNWDALKHLLIYFTTRWSWEFLSPLRQLVKELTGKCWCKTWFGCSSIDSTRSVFFSTLRRRTKNSV